MTPRSCILIEALLAGVARETSLCRRQFPSAASECPLEKLEGVPRTILRPSRGPDRRSAPWLIPIGAWRRPRRPHNGLPEKHRLTPAVDSELVLRSSHQKLIVVWDGCNRADAERLTVELRLRFIKEFRDISVRHRDTSRGSAGFSKCGLSSQKARRGREGQILFVEITSNWRRSSCLRCSV
jgi:hypothetical protein